MVVSDLDDLGEPFQIIIQKLGHAARNDPAQFDLFSSISVCSFATLPGFCDIRILT
jgi:ferritin-like protein